MPRGGPRSSDETSRGFLLAPGWSAMIANELPSTTSGFSWPTSSNGQAISGLYHGESLFRLADRLTTASADAFGSELAGLGGAHSSLASAGAIDGSSTRGYAEQQ